MSTTHKFKAEVTQVLSLVINSLYSNKEIFLRELISNASDALDKLRFAAITEPELLDGDGSLKIRVTMDEEAKTVTIADNGIGMSEEELIKLLGTVAHSGSKAFLEQLKEEADLNIIGQFGVGFYSSYLVADQVEVISRRAGSDKAFVWSSDANDSFTVEETGRATRGTSVILHLKDDQDEYANGHRLRKLVTQYSDFVEYSIEMEKQHFGDDEAPEEPEFEQVNQASALWRRPASEVTDEQYEEFYKHLTNDWEAPLAHTHFKVEGTQMFTGLLYVPKRAPFDLFDPDATHGARLYVKRVFIMENAEDLVPRWLRFMRGVVDSDDLPLNVSRELLQDSRLVKVMRKQLAKKSLELLKTLADDRPEDYEEFWEKYGVVLKEGLHFDDGQRKRLSKLVRFASSSEKKPTSLDDYISRMPEEQTSIYYALGATRILLESSPHLEVLKKKGFEVLYLTDNIDQWAMEGLKEYDGKSLVDAMKEDLDLDSEEEKAEAEEKAEEMKPLTERFQTVLDENIQEVRISHRLADSPACLVIPEGGVASHIERMLRQHRQNMPEQKRILEINPNHPLIETVQRLNDNGDGKVSEWIELIYDQALLAEGSPIANPMRFAQRITGLMQEAAKSQLGKVVNVVKKAVETPVVEVLTEEE